MLTDIYVTDVLVATKCYLCGVAFGLPQSFETQRREDHKSFYCPNGHSQYWARESEAERLKRQLAQTAQCLQLAREAQARLRKNADTLERRVSANRGVVTRMKNRITKGRCVCCSREFKDLERHMKASHPKWNPDKHAEMLETKK